LIEKPIDDWPNILNRKTINQFKEVTNNAFLINELESFQHIIKQYKSTIKNIYAGHFHAEYLSLVDSHIPVIGTLGFSVLISCHKRSFKNKQ
jgi:hypothetical protein